MADIDSDGVPEFRNVEEMESGEPKTITVLTTTEAKDKHLKEQKDETEMPGPKYLDLAFAMDCTGSMGSYIKNATQNIQKIVENIVAEEKADVRLALVEYRDHPPQDASFVTNVHNFTDSVRTMKNWLSECSARGGGDSPEAVADALLQVLKLDWRPDATKVCVFVSDAPPHGLGCCGDGFPDGCPDGIDPMEVTGRLSQKGISLYIVGCEPSIIAYRDFFTSLAHLTGGQYVPLGSAHLLAKVITGGVQEEISLQQLMQEVNQDVIQEFEAGGVADISEDVLTSKVHQKLQSKGARAKKLHWNRSEIPEASASAQAMSSCSNIHQVREMQEKIAPPLSLGRSKKKAAPAVGVAASIGGFFNRLMHGDSTTPPPPPAAAPGFSLNAESSSRAAAPTDTYECIESDISEQQVQRMVQKSVWTNKLNTRYAKKF